MTLFRTLSGRLFLVAVGVVMLTEVLVFVPSVARFREDYLMLRLQMAQIAALALLAAEDEMVEETLEAELLKRAEVSSIALRRDASRQLILAAPAGMMVEETFDLRDAGAATLVRDALAALVRTEPRMIRVIGDAGMGGGEIEITMSEAPLCAAMRAFGERILLISLFISGMTGALVFLVCRRIIVRPIERVVGNMTAFARDPERAAPAPGAHSGLSEIRRAEAALAEMQAELRGALRQKSRLAELGAAVAKISHDLRNMLASAQLLADRLEGSADPVVARIGPKLIGSLDRAAALCVSTLSHGRAEEAPPRPRPVDLRRLVDDVAEAVFEEGGAVAFENHAPAGMTAEADPEHLFRILTNLARNAKQAIEGAGRPGRVSVFASTEEGAAALVIADDGPGLPAKALENLFQPFRGGARRGGAGLGLAIAAELAAMNHGRLTLEETGAGGARFRLTLPRGAPDQAP